MYVASLGFLYLLHLFVVSPLWKMFEMFSESLERFRKLSGWFREVSRPAKMIIWLHTSMKNQVCKQYPSKALQRYLRSRRAPSWEVLRTSGNPSERSQNACWQASEVSQMPQKTHKTKSRVARCTKTHLPSLQASTPSSLQAFTPAYKGRLSCQSPIMT